MTKERRDGEENKVRGLVKKDLYWDWPEHLMREMDRMMSSMTPAWRHQLVRPSRPWAEYPSGVKQPPVDIMETADSIIVTAELPGIEKGDVDVHITEDSIEIEAEMKVDETEEGEDYYRRERRYTSLFRQLALPTEVLPDKAKASMDNGVLEVTVPKVKERDVGKKKKVEVK
ncbi:MAG: Hsp20/alpha crystallin family protein [Thermoplasmata archaeon]